jgi:thermostable 8-oxoguanine DNA glycosylase
MGHEDYVTIDRHAIAACYGVKTSGAVAKIKPKMYTFLAEHYRKVARDLKISPSTLQAVIWVSHRNWLKTL